MTAGEGQGVKVYCPKCKTFVEIDSSTGIKVVKVEKEKKLEKSETPLDIALAVYGSTDLAVLRPVLRRVGISATLVNIFEERKEDIIRVNREIISRKLVVPLKCGHTVTIEPYKLFEIIMSGYYADAVLSYLATKRPSPKDEEKMKIAEFVRSISLFSSLAIYSGTLGLIQDSKKDLIEEFCETLELDDKACNDVRRIVEESKARRGTS